jgi:hypothetical protein
MLIVSFTENSDKCCEDDSFEKSPAAKSKVDKDLTLVSNLVNQQQNAILTMDDAPAGKVFGMR